MRIKNNKRIIALFMALLMVITLLPFNAFVFAADKPLMRSYLSVNVDFHAYRASVVTITILDKIDTAEIDKAQFSWDVSDAGDGSVMAWMNKNEAESAAAGADRYDVYIAGNGGIYANPNSNDLFFGFINLKEFYGLENLDTSKATTMNYMFNQCSSLKTLDLSTFDTSNVTKFIWTFTDCFELETLNLSGWDTSNATTMNAMFKNCYKLNPLDISSFDTRKVTDMANMFYQCKAMTTLYVGDNWSVSQVTSSNAMFNCCYAIVGEKGITYNDPSVSYPHDKKYATTDWFVHYKEAYNPVTYNVSYEFKGDVIPEGVSAPDTFFYNEGSRISVADAPYAEGYVFSGWTTEDAEVTDGEFTLNQDVHFTGTWSKLYTVVYKYDENYPVPDGAPQLPDAVQYTAGTELDRFGVPYVHGYVFVGWTTDDVEVIGDMYEMPENDVVFYGYFKKPVESVEFMNEDIILDADGGSAKLNVYVKPEDATIKDLVYTSSDESVVTVDKYGNINAVGEGEATVTVASKDDATKTDTIKVTVKKLVTDIIVEKNDFVLYKDETDKVEAYIIPEDATNRNINYESSDESIVKVDENGNITAVGEGSTTIIVSSEDDPSVTKTVTVTVKIPVKEVTASDDFTVLIGDERNLEAKVNDDASVKELIYESDDISVVRVDSNGDILAVGKGTATITITSKDDPSKKTQVKVTVEKPVDDVVINTEDTTLEIGEDITLDVTVNPDDATDTSVTYKSSNEDVVKVDENGKVTAVGEGTATVTVVSKYDSSKADSITVTVKKPLIKYVVEHYKMDSSWSPYSKPDKTESFTGEAGETVNGQPVEFDGFAYNFFISDTVATLENGKETVLKLYYEPDTIGGKDGKADGIPDKYQKLITFEVRNGKWDDGTEAKKYSYVTLLKDGRWDESGEAAVVPPAVGSNPNEGYKTGSWNKDFVVGSNDIEVYIYFYVLIETEPETPTPDTPDTPDNPDAPVDPDEPDVPGGSGSVTIPVKHHICFGKTDGIGWYEVSVNGGDFFPQGPNSTLEVEEGSVVVVRTQDMWIDDDFTFYVNGSKVEEIAPNTITFTVNGYMLVGALSMDVEVPDAEESLNLFEKIIKGIKDFFEKIFSIFKKK